MKNLEEWIDPIDFDLFSQKGPCYETFYLRKLFFQFSNQKLLNIKDTQKEVFHVIHASEGRGR